MSVKLIVFNKNKVFFFILEGVILTHSKGIFKLKNHKSDEGNSVMRRQTWQVSVWKFPIFTNGRETDGGKMNTNL